MQSLKEYSNEVLLEETKVLIEKEHEITIAIVECIAEIEARKLYYDLGYSSLWNFCTGYFKKSDGWTYRRIQAARLLREVPESKTALESGSLSLSNAAKLENFFQCEKRNDRPKTDGQKQEILQTVVGLSQSECDAKLFEMSPQFAASQKETLKPVTENQTLLKVVLESAAAQNLELLKDRLASILPGASYSEIIAYLIDDKLKQVEKKKGAPILKPSKKQEVLPNSPTELDTKSDSLAKLDTNTNSPTKLEPIKAEKDRKTSVREIFQEIRRKRKKVSILTLRALWSRSQGRCEEILATGRCNSTVGLEPEHVVPIARGGSNDLQNLKYFCRACNQKAAHQVFGRDFIDMAKAR